MKPPECNGRCNGIGPYKSGNAIVLKGGSNAIQSNKAIVDVMHDALKNSAVPSEAVQFINSTDREATNALFTMKEHIDVLIPRGGGALIQAVVDNATVLYSKQAWEIVIFILMKMPMCKRH